MTPKEKAKELFMFYYTTIKYAHTNLERANIAKQCALKVVEEMILTSEEAMLFKQSKRDWLQQVKRELEAID